MELKDLFAQYGRENVKITSNGTPYVRRTADMICCRQEVLNVPLELVPQDRFFTAQEQKNLRDWEEITYEYKPNYARGTCKKELLPVASRIAQEREIFKQTHPDCVADLGEHSTLWNHISVRIVGVLKTLFHHDETAPLEEQN